MYLRYRPFVQFYPLYFVYHKLLFIFIHFQSFHVRVCVWVSSRSFIIERDFFVLFALNIDKISFSFLADFFSSYTQRIEMFICYWLSYSIYFFYLFFILSITSITFIIHTFHNTNLYPLFHTSHNPFYFLYHYALQKKKLFLCAFLHCSCFFLLPNFALRLQNYTHERIILVVF